VLESLASLPLFSCSCSQPWSVSSAPADHAPTLHPAAALLAACGGAILLLAPMINAKSYIQLEEERKAAAAKMA
jgi:hypothetical protein